MRTALCFALLALAACSRADAPIEGKVVAVNADSFELEVKTLPGLKVDIESTRDLVADEQGLVKYKLPFARLSYAKNSRSLHIGAFGRKGLTKYSASGELQLPMSVSEAESAPKGDHWVKVVGGIGGVSGGILWSLDDKQGALLKKDLGLELDLLAPANAKLKALGHETTADGFGHATLAVTPEEMLKLIPAGAGNFTLGGPAALAFEVTNAGKTETITLNGRINLTARELAPRLLEVPSKPLGGERNPDPLVFYADSHGGVSAAGRDGPLATIDVVGQGAAKPARKVKPCGGYHSVKPGESPGKGPGITLEREAIDEEVTAYDAHTGQKLASKVFEAMDFCPVELRNEPVLRNYPDEKAVNAWLISVVKPAPVAATKAPAKAKKNKK
ncbi:MAG: hypothetical protein QM723_06135 [Myxococcaceae bacterium]